MAKSKIKRKKGRPKTVSSINDGTKIILIPVPEPSEQFEKRASEVRDIIAQIILLGMKSNDGTK